MKRCNNCSAVFSDSFKFCHVCGAKAPLYPTFGGKAAGFGKGALYVMFYFAVQSASSFIFSLIAVLSLVIKDRSILKDYDAFSKMLENQVYGKVSEITIISAVIAFVALFLFFKIRKKKFAAETKFNVSPGAVGIAVVFLGVSLNYMVSLIQAFIPVPEAFLKEYEELYSFMGEGSKVLEFIAVAICAPIIEELVFRALCYGSMRRVMPAWAAAILSGAIFGIAHGNPISFVYTSILGLVLAYLYEKSGSIWAPILLHFGFNAGSYLVQMTFKDDNLVFYAVILFVSTVVTVLLGIPVVKVYSARSERATTRNGAAEVNGGADFSVYENGAQ